ncbi:MAG TPA: tripartite tricarboxylate transporter TctB family protein [Syntrophorhabdaceae bacterium]|nr:tripartite tricarboxylate transporter TctB family protein [Syntrophorhabdaceae bacterium]
MERKGNRLDTVAGAIVLFIGLAIIWQSSRLRLGTFMVPGPGLFPLLIGCIIVLLAGYLIAFPPGGGDGSGFSWVRLRRILPVYISLIAYFFVLEWAGFLLASFALILYLSIVIGKQRIVWAFVRAVIMTGLSYVLFELILKTQLPKGFLGGI